ncbi:MAG TPA: SDR family oxidoreductase [Polyangiaceae bacterium]|nr:SDR family oxidoreductase [Polyangiaceae bacterium]
MRVFVTGATGFIGLTVVKELRLAGHGVLGLARSDFGAEALRAAGADVHRGEMDRLDTLTSGVRAADAVIHLAFNHDFSKFAQNGEQERRAIAALGEALVGTKKLLLVTSGTGMATALPGRPATEDDEPVGGGQFPRTPEASARAFEPRGVRIGIVRLPQVHDTRKAGLVTFVIAVARQKGFVAYVGEGSNCWPAAHVTDVARLYRLALEKTDTFARYQAVAEEGVPMRKIAEVVGEGLRLPVRSITQEEGTSYFGWMGHLASRDLRASSTKTKRALDWEPTGPGLIEDLARFEWV